MTYTVTFYKDRQKFSAAHFTVFEDGEVERLHGHNYTVSASFSGATLATGLLFPFHELKREIDALCEPWDERILLPANCEVVTLNSQDEQVDVHVKTSRVNKRYSFPKEDVVILDCDNVSCENLVFLFGQQLAQIVKTKFPAVTELELSIAESAGQSVSLKLAL